MYLVNHLKLKKMLTIFVAYCSMIKYTVGCNSFSVITIICNACRIAAGIFVSQVI